jgi:thermitase
MKKLSSIVLTAAALGAGLLSNTTNAAEFVVKHKGAIPATIALQTFSANPSIRVMDTHSPGNLLKIHIPDKQVLGVMAKLLKDRDVEYVVPNFKLHRFETPADINSLREQWALAKVKAPDAWNRAGNKGTRNIIVAVIDTGVDYNHESLKINMIPGYDFRMNDSDPMDETSAQNPGHGTHCAGIVGATGLVNGGVLGLSPEVSIMPIRFLGADGSGDLMNGIKSIDYAIEKGAKVISASWGAAVPKSQAQPLIEAVKRASDAGVIFVSAAANDGKSNDVASMYPANAKFENTITVAASDINDAKPSWSNYGKHSVDLAAPGANIISTVPGNKYSNLSGTSMATPLVSGLVALLLAQDSSLSGQDIRSIIQSTAAKVSIETACNCRVDALEAVKAVLEKKLTVVPAAATISKEETLQFKGLYANGPVKFRSSNPEIATISETGVLTPVKEGEVTVTATDADGKTAQSLAIYIGKKSGNGGGPGDGSCPIGNPFLCEILCGIMPELPFCSAASP